MDCRDLDALEEQARTKMSAGAFAFAAGGAEDEITIGENVAAWRRLRLRPRILGDLAAMDTTVHLLGEKFASPIMIAPSGRHRLYHPEGERATARGAADAGACYVLATNSNTSVESVAAQSPQAPKWFQIYLPADRGEAERLVERAVASGIKALVLTADQPVQGWNPRAFRQPVVCPDDIRYENLPGRPVATRAPDPLFEGRILYPTTFDDLRWLTRNVPLDIVVKGVLRGDDAKRCIDAGARAVIVSNHGGRHLDTTISTAEALSEVVQAVGASAEVYVDGGIRRGTDVLKAIALGARAVLIGRPVIWALANDGAAGVTALLNHLRSELLRAMALCSAATLADVSADLVALPQGHNR